jgi:hypothetical protein
MSDHLFLRPAVLLLIGASLVGGGCSQPTGSPTTGRPVPAPDEPPDTPASYQPGLTPDKPAGTQPAARPAPTSTVDKPPEQSKGATSSAPVTKAPTKDAAPAYEGFHDGNFDGMITGWVWDKTHPDRSVKVDIYDGDKLLTTATADMPRPDLKDAGKGSGNYAFAVPIPSSLKDGKTHSIRVKVAGTDMDLAETPQPYPPAPEKESPKKT